MKIRQLGYFSMLGTITIALIALFQPRSTQADSLETKRFPVWITPSSVDKIYGLAIMPSGSGLIFDKVQTVSGVGLHGVGVGFFLPLVPSFASLRYNMYDERKADSLVSKSLQSPGGHLLKVNGALLSVTGTSSEVNGISVSLFCTGHSVMNGLSISSFINTSFYLNGISISAVNDAYRVRGVQIGIFNITHHLNGIQVGILNRSKKRITPIINWSFDK